MFKTTTVDSILSVFTKTITALQEHEANQNAAIANKQEVIANLQQQSKEHEAEAVKARNALNKLQNFFN